MNDEKGCYMLKTLKPIKQTIILLISAILLLTAIFMIQPTSAKAVDGIAVYRMYNPNTGEHLHTLNWNEKVNLEEAGWDYEGISMRVGGTGSELYRLYNPNTGEHFYTLNWNEKTNLVSHGWRYEGVAWKTTPKGLPVYRVYNPNARDAGTHHYTLLSEEVASLVKVGWKSENVAWFAVGGAEPYVPAAGENNLYSKRLVTKGVIIHNDAGTLRGSQYRFLKSYSTTQLANGFAHYYVAKDDVYQFWDDTKVAWHSGSFSGNTEYVGIEVTNSYGATRDFLANEQESFKLTATILKKYGLKPNRNTIRLHREFYATACPHRSWELHGRSVTAVKDYFINEVSKYM